MKNRIKTKKARLIKYLLILSMAFTLVLTNNAQTQTEEITSFTFSDPDKITPNFTPNEKGVFSHVKQMPSFPGGNEALMKFIADNIEYPKKAIESAIQGRVILRFVVRKSGKISDIEILRSVHSLLDAEAVRVVESMPNFIPGELDGEKVDLYFQLPINFRLQAEEKPLPQEEAVAASVEIMPSFPGGDTALMKFLADNLRYPKDAERLGIQGRVELRFVVRKTGKVDSIEVTESVHPSLDREAVRVVKSMPNFIPGEKDGEKVDVYFKIPINFRMNTNGKARIVLLEDGTTLDNQLRLWIVDGVSKGRQNADYVNNLNTDNIESIIVYEGEAAIKHYGEEAKDGVLVITTKKKN